jgi:FKBP-type peptidyl-prolyl cis-trans isomerase
VERPLDFHLAKIVKKEYSMKRIAYLSMAVMFAAFSTTACSEQAAAPTPKMEKSNMSELIKNDTKLGTGALATGGKHVTVHYTGWLYDETAPEHKGKKFDSSRDRREPFDFALGAGQVIKGWDQGFDGMKVGGQRTLIIPSAMGYGARGAGGLIPPNATLVFDVELLGVN